MLFTRFGKETMVCYESMVITKGTKTLFSLIIVMVWVAVISRIMLSWVFMVLYIRVDFAEQALHFLRSTDAHCEPAEVVSEQTLVSFFPDLLGEFWHSISAAWFFTSPTACCSSYCSSNSNQCLLLLYPSMIAQASFYQQTVYSIVLRKW